MGVPETQAETLSPLGRGRDGAEHRTGEGVRCPTEFARTLRQRQTDPERLLWSRLRARRLCGWKFRRQVPIGRFIADFCCPDGWLVVELDGGGHSHDDVARRDETRTREIEGAGYLVVRFWNREVIENLDGICETILAQIEAKA